MPKIKTVRGAGGGRLYEHPRTLQTVPSVTTILNVLAKPALVGWAAREVATYAVEHQETWANQPSDDAVSLLKGVPFRRRDKAGQAGTDVHTYAEERLAAKPADPTNQPEANVDSMPNAVKLDPLMVEETVWHSRVEYAGTFDLIARVGKEQWLIDWKSSSGVYPDMALQLAAYRHAECVVLPDGKEKVLPRIDRVFIFHVPKDTADFAIVELKADLQEFAVFRNAAALASWTKNNNDTVGQRLQEWK